ncbi:MAG: helix-hairpin-helix domain-containing protein [Betaproteobacteria bacterium]|nr:helix-hairpin-helix domain-containing protein [Betaproteobacteria bacterium]
MIRNFLSILLAVFALNAFAAVDANQATRADLETVKGIGPGLSGKIVDARKTGNFKDWSDLVERVGGIGAGNAARFSQAGLTVGGSAFDPTAAAPAPAKEVKKSKKAEKSEKAGKADKPAA